MNDEELRLLGSVAGKRVLQLGGAEIAPAIALAHAGAHVIAVVPDRGEHDRARAQVEGTDAKVELQHVDLADLAFIRADTVDAAYADSPLRRVDDLDRVFRQVHRVLRTTGRSSWPCRTRPATSTPAPTSTGPTTAARSATSSRR